MTDKVKKALRKILKEYVVYPIAAVSISAAAAMLLLCLVYLLPTNKIELHIKSDFDIFYIHSEYGEHFVTNPDHILLSVVDDYSDLLMMSNCFARRPNDPFYKAALRATYIGCLTDPNDTLHGYNPIQGMIQYVIFNNNYTLADYSRYWNGYQVILIPLLTIFSYKNLLKFNIIVTSLTAAAAVWAVSHRFGKLYGAAYAAAIFTLYPFVIPVCLQYCAAAYVTLISTIVFCLNKKEDNIPKIFLFAGIIVSFLDLLSYPALSAGVLSALLVLLYMGKKNNTFIISRLFVCLVMWGFGYGAMFLYKWLLDALILGPQELMDALVTARYRIDGANYSLAYLSYILKELLERTATRDVFVLSAAFAVICILSAIHSKGRRKYRLTQLWLLILPVMVMLGWFIIMRNHTIQHTFFAIRNFSVIWFCLFAFAASFVQKENTQ
ncbi:MAG: hypothetical protein IJR45_07730 [Firmicutes bacterium]|nr:hypothetical protein [Bacillota bacterium]MBQ9605287.1 hypothetical protein [Bacillota bacterium]